MAITVTDDINKSKFSEVVRERSDKEGLKSKLETVRDLQHTAVKEESSGRERTV